MLRHESKTESMRALARYLASRVSIKIVVHRPKEQTNYYISPEPKHFESIKTDVFDADLGGPGATFGYTIDPVQTFAGVTHPTYHPTYSNILVNDAQFKLIKNKFPIFIDGMDEPCFVHYDELSRAIKSYRDELVQWNNAVKYAIEKFYESSQPESDVDTLDVSRDIIKKIAHTGTTKEEQEEAHRTLTQWQLDEERETAQHQLDAELKIIMQQVADMLKHELETNKKHAVELVRENEQRNERIRMRYSSESGYPTIIANLLDNMGKSNAEYNIGYTLEDMINRGFKSDDIPQVGEMLSNANIRDKLRQKMRINPQATAPQRISISILEKLARKI